jgi:hypothetical protein
MRDAARVMGAILQGGKATSISAEAHKAKQTNY